MAEEARLRDRAQLLFQQGRYDQAERVLREFLVGEPDDGHAHALLGLCLLNLNRVKEALEETGEAIRVDPQNAYTHYARAFVLLRQDRYKLAEVAVSTAIKLNSWNPTYFALLAEIRLESAQWKGAIEAAEAGLALQADHVGCINARARAMMNLGRHVEGMQTVDTALRLEPDNAFSHANKGWALVQAKRPKEALEQFREALRLQPNMNWARQGLVVALKAQNPIYRVVLGYFLWMGRLPKNTRIGIVAGLWVFARAMSYLSNSYPQYARFFAPLGCIYILFCFTTWTADPLSNALLRFNRYGRYALTRKEIVGSTWVAAAFAIGVLSLLAWLFRHREGEIVLGFGFLGISYVLAITTKSVSSRASGIVLYSLIGLLALLFLVYGILVG